MRIEVQDIPGFEVFLQCNASENLAIYGKFYAIQPCHCHRESRTMYLQKDGTLDIACLRNSELTGWFSSLSEVRAAAQKYNSNELATQVQEVEEQKAILESGAWDSVPTHKL